jgi:predicted TIM-barrel fold metal-dependent hydrolase
MSTVLPDYVEPPVVKPFLGKVLDGDGHMYMDAQTLREIAGPLDGGHMVSFIEEFMTDGRYDEARSHNVKDLWSVKGIGAMGAHDAEERKDALDLMGIDAQLVFYNTGSGEYRINSDAARAACSRYNDYGIAWQKSTGGRGRVAMQINMGTVDGAIAELKRVLKAGANCICLPGAEPPAGVSPAHELWDPFWAICEEANIAVTVHLGAGGLMANKNKDILDAEGDKMYPERGWGNAAALRGQPANRPGGEEAISPYYMMVAHQSPELFLVTMIMGSVFERFPKLRFGIIECGASWLGPMVERMDTWAEFMGKVGRKYSLKPSEFVQRNVRITPFWNENLPKMIERYGMKEAYIFSTDYPHLEGSRDPYGKFAHWLKDLPADYAQEFFVDNAKLLFPDL